jgi:hypothetical protein
MVHISDVFRLEVLMSATNSRGFVADPEAQEAAGWGCRALDCRELLAAVEGLAQVIVQGDWPRSVASADALLAVAGQVRGEMVKHFAEMEGPGGLSECVGNDCPHLTPRIRRLADEHGCLRSAVAEIEAMLERYRLGIGSAHAIRGKARNLLCMMRGHQETGNGLVLEAYSTDLGAGD